MTNLDTQVGKVIHLHMWDRHITQTSLAPKLGMTQSGLSKKLRGDRPWTLDELYRAAAALGCTINDLLPAPVYVNGGYGPHTLRHRYATRIYAATGDVLAVQQLLGHASLATTQTYLGLSEDRLIAAAAAAA